MKILPEESVTKHLKSHLKDHKVYTVREMLWSGIKNGRLIELCIEHDFDILLSIDKNLQYQQALVRFPITIVILDSFTSNVDELITFLPAFRNQILEFKKHKAYLIDKE